MTHFAPQLFGFVSSFCNIIDPLHVPQRRVEGEAVALAPKTLSETKLVYLKTKIDNSETVTNNTATVRRRYLITLLS